jgi:hypothetical protein
MFTFLLAQQGAAKLTSRKCKRETNPIEWASLSSKFLPSFQTAKKNR